MAFWQLAKNYKQDEVGILSIQGSRRTPHDNHEKATCFSSHFQSVFSLPISGDGPALASSAVLSYDVHELVISSDGLVKRLQSLKTDKSPGPGGMPNIVLLECSGVLYMFLCVSLTRSLSDCYLPNDGKKAHVVSVHKGGANN